MFYLLCFGVRTSQRSHEALIFGGPIVTVGHNVLPASFQISYDLSQLLFVVICLLYPRDPLRSVCVM